MRPAHDPSAELAIEPDGALVLRQRPDDNRPIAVARQILARRLEHAPPEATALALRREIEFEDLPAVAERRNAVLPIAHIADDGPPEFEHEQRRAARDRQAPPRRAAARDHPLKLAAGNHAAISLAPGGVMNRGDIDFVAQSRRSNGNDRFDHATMLSRRAAIPQGLDSGPAYFFARGGLASESAHSRRIIFAIAVQSAPRFGTRSSHWDAAP